MQYKVILSDFPWQFRNKKTGGSMKSGSEDAYAGNTMSLEEIAKFPIGQIAHKNSLHFLWVPVALSVHEAPKIIEHWRYRFHTKIFWEKGGKIGMGWWFRGQVEELWVLSRGRVPCLKQQKKNVIHLGEQDVLDPEHPFWMADKTPTNLHSAKSPIARYIIDKAVEERPDLRNSKIELFAREQVHGWHCWGLEAPRQDIDLFYP